MRKKSEKQEGGNGTLQILQLEPRKQLEIGAKIVEEELKINCHLNYKKGKFNKEIFVDIMGYKNKCLEKIDGQFDFSINYFEKRLFQRNSHVPLGPCQIGLLSYGPRGTNSTC